MSAYSIVVEPFINPNGEMECSILLYSSGETVSVRKAGCTDPAELLSFVNEYIGELALAAAQAEAAEPVDTPSEEQ